MARSQRSLAFAAVTLGAVMTLAACSDSGSEAGEAPVRRSSTTTTTTRPALDGRLVIGQLAPFTGPIATIAPAFVTPVQLAVDEINLAGGVNGEPVTLVVADDASDREVGRGALATLVDTDHADGVVGPSSSDIAATLIPGLADDHVVVCSGSNTAGALTDLDSGGYYLRTAPGDALQAIALAELVRRDGHDSAVVFAPATDDPFARRLMAALDDSAVRARRVTVDPDRVDAAVAAALRRDPAAAVVLGDAEATAPVLRALIAAGAPPLTLATYGTDALQAGDLGLAVDPANPGVVAGLRGTTPAGAPAGLVHPLADRMLAAGVEPFFSASAYDCTVLIALAAEATGTDDADRIRRRIPKLLTGTADCSTFVECRDLLDEDRSVHYRGAFSRYPDWQGTEPGAGVYDVWVATPQGRTELQTPGEQLRATLGN